MVRTTLQKLTERLPRVLQNRYSQPAGEFWVKTYNDLLGELERTACGPNGLISVPVPWEMCQGEVVLPQQLTDVVSAYRSVPGDSKAELDIAPSEGGFFIQNTDVPAESTLVAHSAITGIEQARGRDFIKGTAIADALVGDAIITHNATPAGDVYYMPDLPTGAWVAFSVMVNPSNEPMCAIPYETGEQDWAPAESEHAFVLRNFLVIKGHRRYKRVTSMDSLTSIPPDWDDLAATWLRFKGEHQTDAESEQTLLWAKSWQAQAERWKSHHSKLPAAMRPKNLRLPLVMNERR